MIQQELLFTDIILKILKLKDLLSIIIISILHCGVVAHLPSDIVGAVGVVDVDLGRPPEVPHLLALDQPDDEEDQECDEKGTCL